MQVASCLHAASYLHAASWPVGVDVDAGLNGLPSFLSWSIGKGDDGKFPISPPVVIFLGLPSLEGSLSLFRSFEVSR